MRALDRCFPAPRDAPIEVPDDRGAGRLLVDDVESVVSAHLLVITADLEKVHPPPVVLLQRLQQLLRSRVRGEDVPAPERDGDRKRARRP